MRLSFLEVDLFPRINRFYAGSINKQFLHFHSGVVSSHSHFNVRPPIPVWTSSHLLLGSRAWQSQSVLYVRLRVCYVPQDVCLRVTLSALLSFNAYSLFPGLFIINSHSLHLSASIWLFLYLLFSAKTVFLPKSAAAPRPHSFLHCLQLFISSSLLSLRFCFGDTGWLCGPEQFWPSRCLWPRSITGFPFRAWPITAQGAIDVARQADTSSGRTVEHLVPQKLLDLPLM